MSRFRGFAAVPRLVTPTRRRKQQKQEYQDAVTANDTREYIVTTDEAVPTPPANQVSHYRTADGWREKDDTGTASDVGGGGATVNSVTTSITSTQLLNAHTTAIELVPAPAAGEFLIPLAIWLKSDAGETPYDMTGAFMQVSFANAVDDPDAENLLNNVGTDLFTHADDKVHFFSPDNWSDGFSTPSLGKPIIFRNSGAGLTAGNGTLTITVVYAETP